MRGFAKSTGLAALALIAVSPLAMTAARAASSLSSTTIDYLMEQGDRFAIRGEYEAARAEYEILAELLIDEGRVPVTALRRREQLASLLSSSAVPDGVREQIRSHVRSDLRVFAPHLSSW